jgi:carboxyl-terminal processing protease
MKRSSNLVASLVVGGGAIATPIFVALICVPAGVANPIALEGSPKEIVDEVWQLVNTEFIDKDFNHHDWLKKRGELLGQSYATRAQAYKAIRQALKELDDPYTRFLAPEDFTALTSQTSGELSGIGVQIAIDKRNSQLVIVDTFKNSPARSMDLKQGDRILRIDGKPTALMSLEQASEAMTGEIGTDVSLQILRNGKGVFEVTLTRAQIEVPAVSYAAKTEGSLKIGYIKLDEFSSHATEQMQEAIKNLDQENVTGYVLDLRGNPGGLLFASVDIARLWMQRGEIVSTVDRLGGDRKFAANGTAITNRPLILLVDEGSASASEILAGALKENGRATLVGTPTYGKGTVQSVHSLTDGSGLAVTIARYYPPSGTDINHKGIAPDIVHNLTREQQQQLRNDPDLMGTAADPQYKRAVTIFKTQHANFIPNLPNPVGIKPAEPQTIP